MGRQQILDYPCVPSLVVLDTAARVENRLLIKLQLIPCLGTPAWEVDLSLLSVLLDDRRTQQVVPNQELGLHSIFRISLLVLRELENEGAIEAACAVLVDQR